MIGVHSGVQFNIKQFLGNRDPLDVTDFTGRYASRDVVEYILLLQALHLGGYDGESKPVSIDYYARSIRLIKQGAIHLTSSPLWLQDIQSESDNIFISDPLVREGEFEAGLYIYAAKRHLLAYQSLEQIQQLTAVSNRNWQSDWQVLESLNLSGITHSGQFTYMANMLVKNRADFMLMQFFNRPDLSYSYDGNKFIPIPNVKVIFPGSRHFAMSKKFALAGKVSKALNFGLYKLRTAGVIRKAYEQSGYFNKSVRGWRILNLSQ